MIYELYERLLAHFGAPHKWWPIFGDDAPFEMLLGAVLVQQTRWEAVEAAILRLRDAGLLGAPALADADAAELAALLRPVAFHSQKAPGLITICRHLCERYGGSVARMLDQPTGPLRRELLALPRIGPETADVIMLYAGSHAEFVVDDYTRRLLERVDPPPAFPWRKARYDAVKQQIADALTHRASCLVPLYADYHALINEECVRYCLEPRPRCDGPPARRIYSLQADRESYLGRDDGCPLRELCAFYKAQSAAREAE
jgi:endonuclease-3 related protein